jgi:hypothetical protein
VSAKCSTTSLSKLLTAVKTGIQGYCDTSYSRGDVNQLWILKNSKDMLEYIKSRSLSSCCSIKTFDFSTLYTTIPHSKLRDRLREMVQLCFIQKNDRWVFFSNHSGSTKTFSETDINMLEFLIDNIFVMFGGCVFQHSRHTHGYKLCSGLFSSTCSFIRMRQTSYRGILQKSEKNQADPLISRSAL